MSRQFTSYEDAWDAFRRAERMDSFLDAQPDKPAFLLTWHISVAPAVAEATTDLREALRALGHFVILPSDLLHVSVFPVGTTASPEPRWEKGELPRGRRAWRRMRRFGVRFGPVNCFPTAVVAEVHDAGPFEAVGLLREGPPPPTFLPHMTLAIAASRRPAGDVRPVLEPLREDGAIFGEQEVRALELRRLRVGPGSLLEQWTVVGRVDLG